MIKAMFYVIFLLLATRSNAQLVCDSFTSVNIKNKGICVDKQQQVYAYNESGFTRFSKDGILLKTYQFSEMGELADMDINPAGNIILLYNNAPLLVILDKNLIEIGRIRLDNLGLDEAQLCTFANDGNILLYSYEERRILKIDFNGNIKQPLTKLILLDEPEFAPTDMREEKNVIYMADPQKGLYQFDVYGKNTSKTPCVGTGFLQLIGDKLLFIQNQNIVLNQLKSLASMEIRLPEKTDGLKQAVMAGITVVTTDGQMMRFYRIRP